MEYNALDFSGIKTDSAFNRHNLVRIDTLLTPGEHHALAAPTEELKLLAEKIISARKNGRQVIWSQGAHVIKNSLSRYIIEHHGSIEVLRQ